MKRTLSRLAWAIVTIWGVATLTFVIHDLLPSDPARMAAGAQARPEDVARVRASLGLDRPVRERYARFLGRLVHVSGSDRTDAAHASCGAVGALHVDLGRSYQQRRPVVDILAERLPRTLGLALFAVVIQAGIGVAFGLIAAAKRRSLLDHAVVGSSLIGFSAPTFVIGLVIQFVFAHKLRWLPLDGFGQTFADHVECAILPALTLGIFGAAYYTRLVRDEAIVLGAQDFARTAKAKGAGAWRVWVHHVLRNALAPIATVFALDLGALVGGAVVTETMFRWPGLGALSVKALTDRDGPVLMGTVLVTSTAVVLSNWVVDALYVALDPRVRTRRSG